MYLGEKEIKECPHREVSRSYNSPPSAVPQWKCDWCGQAFSPATAASRTVEISEEARLLDTMKEFAEVAENLGTSPRTSKKKEKSYAS